ncbi:MAG: DNA-binding protein [Desulfocapsa sp.]|nr:MAG: DNA-binding protein [Desulfocapsa sp.]
MKKTLYRGLAICLFIGLAAHSGDANAGSEVKEAKAPAPAAAQAPGNLSGTVLETMNSAGYTYLQLDTGSAKTWIAIPQAKVAVGDKISCQPGMVMKNFSSKTLGRSFDSIVFSNGLVGGAVRNPHAGGMGMGAMGGGGDDFSRAVAAEGGAAPKPQVQGAGSGGSLGAIAPFSEIKVEKASGDNAYTVNDAFSKKDDLNGKTVRIRGQVVKFSPMIMGRNWVHLQDGTGDPMNNTHDLVFTTAETVKKGDTITMEGVLTANKDFGAGYRYEAIIEKAKVVK